MQTKNNYERKNIWFDKEKFEECQDKLTQQNWFYTATPVETLTHCTSKWIKTDNDLKNFCFYFSDILKTHLYDKKENRWLENPFDDNNFCEAMFNLLNENKANLSRNCVLLLEGICFPNIHTNGTGVIFLFQTIIVNGMNLFFTNKWNHMPKPSGDFISFLRKQINRDTIENYCTKFVTDKLKLGLAPNKLSLRNWIFVKAYDDDIQTKNNFIMSYLSLFLDKKFKYPFECKKDGLDFITSAMDIYENMYKTFMQLTHSKKEDAIDDFFNVFSTNFTKYIIYAYREDKTVSIKYKHGIYLIDRFCKMLSKDTDHLNSVLENLFRMIDVRQDFVLPYKNSYGSWNFMKLWTNVAKNYVANKLSSEKSIDDFKDGKILNYSELLPDELIDKMKKYNDKSKSELQFDIKQEIFLIKNGIFYCDENKFLENIESICKIFGLISNKDGKAKKIDDIHLRDFFKLLADNKFNLFKYVRKLESCYGGVAIRGIEFLISEFEKFINYHSVENETNKLFLSNSNDNTFTKKHLFPNPYVCSLYNLMITKFIKAQTESDDLADIVSILLKKFGSIYNLINQVKDILAEKDYGYKLKSLWNFVLDCVLHVDKEINKSVLSLLIKLVNDHLKKYTEENDLEQGEIALSLVQSAVLLFNVAKAFDYDTNIFCEGTKSENGTSKKTFDLLNKIIEDENFKLFFELDKTLPIDLESIKMCFQQMKNLNFEVLFYLTDEIFNPNVKQLEQFSPLLEKCKDLCSQNNKITVFDIIRKTETLVQKKVSKMERLNKIKNEAKKIKNYANEIKVNNLENKNLFLDQIQTETEKEISKANDLVNKLLKQAKKVVGSIDIGERGSYLLHSDLLNEYFNSLYEIFCMVYDPKQHSNLNSKYKNTYIEIISDSYNSTMVTKISEYTISAITSLNKKNIFEKIDEMENVDTEIIGNIIWLIKVNSNDQVVFFKNKNGENIIFSVIDGLQQLQTNIIDYKKKLGLFNTDQLLNELKNYKYQEISFGDKLIKKAERKQERLLNNLDIKSGQFDAELYKKKKKAMTQLTDLNIYTIKLIASLCILKSTDNYVANVADTVNHFCKKLHDFLDTLYVSEDEKKLNSGYKDVCTEIISNQKQLGMVIEISKFTIDAIKFLNEKDIFEKVDLPKYEGDGDIDIKTIDHIISLLSNLSQKDIVFFKNEKGENITSDIIDGFKLLKTNLKINELRQKFQKCKSDISSSNACFNDLHNFLSILKEPKAKEQEIYTEVLSNKKNPQMFMLAETSNIILEIIKILNSKDFDGKKLKDIDANIIKAIIGLLSQDSQKTDIVFFKNEKGGNITSDIIDGFKLLKTNLKINELRQKFQKCKENYPQHMYLFVLEAKEGFESLRDFLLILKAPNSEEHKIYTEVLSNKKNPQMFMLAETSNIILEIIKILNSKDFDGEKLKDIDANIIEAIIDLISQNNKKTDIVFFKNEKDQNITSDIVDSLKLLKTNLKINELRQEFQQCNELRQKFQQCKENYPQYIYAFIAKANEGFKSLRDFLLILKGPKSKEQEIYTEVLFGKQNSQVFMLAETLNIILDIIKILNSKDFDGKILKDIDANIIKAIIGLLSQDSQKTDIVFFKDEKCENITSDIIDGFKLLKTNLRINELRQEFQKCRSDISSSNACFNDLRNFLSILKEPKSKEQEIYTEVLSNKKNPQMFMLAETSNIILDVIKILNNKDFDGEKLKDIDANIIEAIIELISQNNKKTDIVFFKNEKDQNITSDIVDSLKLLKTNLKINELRQEFQQCKENYPKYICAFIAEANEGFKSLRDFLLILKGPKSKEQEIYTEVLFGKQNSQVFMLAETLNIILEIIKNLNNKHFDGEKLKNINANIIEAIIELLSRENKKTDIIFFKNDKVEDITSNIIENLKLLKTNLTDYIYNQENEKISRLLENLRLFTKMALLVDASGKILGKKKTESKEINECLNRLHNVFCILYDTEKVEGLKSEYKEIYKRIICDSKNAELVLKMSQHTENLINKLNEQDFFDSIDDHKNINVGVIDSIVSLFLKDRDEKTVLFKNDKGEDITSNIIDGLKLLKTNIESYIYDEESKKAIKLLTELKDISLISWKVPAEKINKCFDNLYKVLCMIYVPEKIDDLKSKYKELYRKTISDSKNLALVLKISERLEKLINNLNNKISEYVENPQEIKIETIESIIKLFSDHSNENVIIFKNQQEANITSDIFDKMKKLKENLSQYINDKSKLQTSNTNQNKDENKIDTDTNKTNASDDRKEFLNEENDDKNTIQYKNDTSKNDCKQNIKNNIDESANKFTKIKNLFGNVQKKLALIDENKRKRSKSLHMSHNKIEILLNEINSQEVNDGIENKVDNIDNADKNNNEHENENNNLLCTENNLNTKNKIEEVNKEGETTKIETNIKINNVESDPNDIIKREDTNDDASSNKSDAIEENRNEIENKKSEKQTLISVDKFQQNHSCNDGNKAETNNQTGTNKNDGRENLEAHNKINAIGIEDDQNVINLENEENENNTRDINVNNDNNNKIIIENINTENDKANDETNADNNNINQNEGNNLIEAIEDKDEIKDSKHDINIQIKDAHANGNKSNDNTNNQDKKAEDENINAEEQNNKEKNLNLDGNYAIVIQNECNPEPNKNKLTFDTSLKDKIKRSASFSLENIYRNNTELSQQKQNIPTTTPNNKKKTIFAIIFGIIFVLSVVFLSLALTIEALNFLALVISMAVVVAVTLITTIAFIISILQRKKMLESLNIKGDLRSRSKSVHLLKKDNNININLDNAGILGSVHIKTIK